MKKFLFVLIFSLLLFACQEKINPESLTKINGYWEIQKVTLAYGQQKDYTINETIDYFEWNQNSGFRKKVTPQFDGTFLTNDESEEIQIKDSSNATFIHYKTAYDQWSEQILEISDSVLVLKNKQNLEYHYKRYKPFSIK